MASYTYDTLLRRAHERSTPIIRFARLVFRLQLLLEKKKREEEEEKEKIEYRLSSPSHPFARLECAIETDTKMRVHVCQ